MPKPQVLILGKFFNSPKELAELQLEYDVITATSQTRDEFYADLETKYKDVEIIARQFPPPHLANLQEDFAARLPKSVKGLVICAAGYDGVDVEAFTKRNIWVTNTPAVVDDCSADTALYLLLGAMRNFWIPQKSLRAGKWRGDSIVSHNRNPKGKLLGILGLGGIGKAVAMRAIPLGMKIQYHNRNRLDSEIEKAHQAQYVSFATLLSSSDVILVSIPLNSSTKHLIGKKEIEQMKKGVVIVNIARGGILDEAEIVAGLESGQIASVGLDVYENEPEIHPGLIANDRAVLLPHLGSYTEETLHEMEVLSLRNITSLLKTETPVTPINQIKPLPPPKKAADTFDEAEEAKEDIEAQSGENAFWMISRNPKRASKVLSQLDFSDLQINL